MAESQKSVGTDAITAIIAAIPQLMRSRKKAGLSFEEYRDALLSMYREMPHEDASGDPGQIFDGHAVSARTRDKESPETT
jgi:hypothetical protein